MNMVEYIASGNRHCRCKNVSLVVVSYERKTEKLYSQNPMRNLVLSATFGIRYNKPVKKWAAVCSQCEKYYLFGDTKKELLKNLDQCGLPFNSNQKKEVI